MKKYAKIIFFCFLMMTPMLITGQDAQSAELSVQLASSAEPGHVALNRPVTLTVQVSWQGSLNRIEIEEVEEPLLSHLEIAGTASANHILGGNVPRAVKEIIYTLKPTTLGMAYIESVVLHYSDAVTGETHLLRTERIGIEVLPPVREKSKAVFPGWVVIVLILFAAGILLLFRSIRLKRRVSSETPRIPSEVSYLESLKSQVPLKDGDRNQGFFNLSKLCRRYLAERYQIPALEATTQSLMDTLRETELEDSVIQKLRKLFEEADVIKFSGQEAGQAALESAYTTFESLLERNLAGAREAAAEMTQK